MPDILTITLNPALDVSTTVDRVRPEDKLRCDVPVLDPGGGGVNVARAVGALGGRALALIAVAGFNGQQFLAQLHDEPIVPVAFPIAGETRQSLAVTDRSTGEQYRFVMPGPRWNEEQAQEALVAINRAMGDGAYVVLSGSQPPGVPQHFPTDLAAIVEERQGKLVLDTSGKALEALLKVGSARQHVLRLDGSESEDLAGRPLRSIDEFADFAQELVHRGVAEVVVLAMGAHGSVLAEDGRRWHAVTEPVKVRSKVGAGDSFVGAFTLAVSRGASWEEALVQGVAAASAAVTTDATDLCEKSDVEALVRTATLKQL